MIDFALLVPCYNEATRIQATSKKLVDFFVSEKYWSDKTIVIVFINDGSKDKTSEIIQNFTLSNSNVSIKAVSYSKNKGKGGAIQAGLKAVEAKNYGFIDADLSFDLSNITAMHQQLAQADCVIGERNLESLSHGYGWIRKTASRFFHRFTQLLTGLPFIDTQCGIKLFNHKAAQFIAGLTHTRFAFDVEFLSKLQTTRHSIISHPVTFARTLTSSIKLSDGLRYFLDVVSISDHLNRPLSWRFYFLLSALSAIITFAFFGWIIQSGYFFSDDFTWLWHGKKAGLNLHNILTFMMSSFYSPVLNAFYAISFRVAGLYAPYYFIFGLLVHIAVSILSGVLVQRLFSSRIITVLTVVLVALAGGAREPILWVGANMHSIATLFILLSLVFFDRFLVNKKILSFTASLIFFLLALGTKETAVILPGLFLMIMVLRWKKEKSFILRPSTIISGLLFLAPYCLYLFKQYKWQTSGIWVSNGTWNLDIARAILRFPFIALDLFVPIQPLIAYSHSIVVGLAALLLLGLLLKKYWHLPTTKAGLYWIIVTIAPTIFFISQRIAEPLASRYTYLPRIGLVIIIAGLFAHYIKNNSSRSVINFFVFILLAVSLSHIVLMIKTTESEYKYVYNTGRTLVDSVRKINPSHQIFVHNSRPFSTNEAHIVGVFDLVYNIKESQLTFISEGTPQKDSIKNLPPTSTLLYWHHDKKMYTIISK